MLGRYPVFKKNTPIRWKLLSIEFFRRLPNQFILRIVFIFIVITFLPIGNLAAFEKNLPFYAGETLTFQLKWSMIPVGEAVLKVLPVETIAGIESYHFVMTAKSYPIIDILYKVRDRIDAYADLGMNHSILFKKKQEEGKTKRDEVVNFDWKSKEAQYSNFEKKKAPIPILPGSFDPLSVLYYARLLNLEEGSELQCPVTDGKKSIVGKAKVIKRETIRLGGEKYDTYLLEPELKDIRGVFEKSKNAEMKLWITADNRRIPVKIKSKVIVGDFVGELVSAEMGHQIHSASVEK
ncbi:MAG TPA: DUF3108 domain-containing protein [Desulfobacterales bacterium]|nr:DUF3108 domain-containing protein [Desulfobacterales bacterium]